MKKVLIIGGTLFIGRALVEAMLEVGGYEITLFNRGKTNPDLFPSVSKMTGDRETDDVTQIAKNKWDCVIDMCAYYPNTLDYLLQHIKDKTDRFIFISTMSVYRMEESEDKLIGEDFPVYDCTEEEKIDKSMHTYGKRKAECERVIWSYKDLDCIVLRPALVYGKYDFTDRFYYWLYRLNKGGQMLLPGGGTGISTNTFVDDLAKIIIKAIDIEKHGGVYNVNTYPRMPLKEQVELMGKAMGKKPDWVNVSSEFLETENIRQWADIAMWLHGNYMMVDNEKIIKDFKLSFDSFEESARKTASYYAGLGWPEPKYGITIEREQELIQQYLSAQSTS